MAPTPHSVTALKQIAQSVADGCDNSILCPMCCTTVCAKQIVSHFTDRHDDMDYRFKCFLCFERITIDDVKSHFEQCMRQPKLPALGMITVKDTECVPTELGKYLKSFVHEEYHQRDCCLSKRPVPALQEPVAHLSPLILLEGDVKVRPLFFTPDYSQVVTEDENFRLAVQLVAAFKHGSWYYAILDKSDPFLKSNIFISDFWKEDNGKLHLLMYVENFKKLRQLEFKYPNTDRVVAAVRDIYSMTVMLMALSEKGEKTHRTLSGRHLLQLLFLNPISVLHDIYYHTHTESRFWCAPVYHVYDKSRIETCYSKLEDVVNILQHYSFKIKDAKISIDDKPRKGFFAMTLDGKCVNVEKGGPGISMVDVVNAVFPNAKMVWSDESHDLFLDTIKKEANEKSQEKS